MRRRAWVLFLALLVLGCRPGGELPGAAQTSPQPTTGRTGATANPLANGEPAADSPTPPIKTTADTGALTGVLLLKTEDGLKPVVDIKIALGKPLSDDEGTERVVAYEPSTAPVAYTDATGRFVFEELESGRYGLILDVVLSSFLLYREGTIDAILFDITAGEVTDLGRLEYAELPLPQSYR
jgi:hypothetical protein